MIDGALYGTLLIRTPAVARGIQGAGSATTFAMAALNSCCAFRVRARDVRDFYSFWVNFSAITAAGVIQARLETCDATTLKPTGTLYDTNAVVSFTPVAGWQQITFATPPSTHPTVDSLYALTLITTTGGTTMTLRAYVAGQVVGGYGSATQLDTVLTAADGSTRSNLTDLGLTTGATGCVSFVMSDGVEETFGHTTYTASTNQQVFGKKAEGVKIVLASPVWVSGILAESITNGAVASMTGDCILDLRDVSNTLIGSSTITQKLWTTDFATRSVVGRFPAPILIPAGTYRATARHSNQASVSSANFNVSTQSARTSATTPQSFVRTETADITATPIVWTDTNTDVAALGLILSDLSAPVVGRSLIRQAPGSY